MTVKMMIIVWRWEVARERETKVPILSQTCSSGFSKRRYENLTSLGAVTF